MSTPREAALLQEVARRLAETFVAAAALVGRSEEENRRREEETARVADVLGKADPAARRRVMSARRAASAAELRATYAMADEMRYQAGSRALAGVHRYAGTLAAAAEEANSLGRQKLAQLGEVFDRLDASSSRTLLGVIERAEAKRVASARRQADDLSLQIRAAMGTLPTPPAELEERPRARKARRRAARSTRPAGAMDGIDQADVVILDPKRRRSAT